MGNLLVIVKKEFTDLLNSKLIIIILLAYLVPIFLNIYIFQSRLDQGTISQSDVFELSLGSSLFTISYYGGLIAVVIGCSSIASEKHNHALNVLLTKPLQRTTVINGKLLGIFSFLFVVLAIAVILYVSSILIISGSAIQAYFFTFILRIPVVLLMSLAYCMVFSSLSILVSTIVRSQMLALTISTFSIVLSQLVITDNFAGTISLVFQSMFGISSDEVCYYIVNLFPPGIIGLTGYRGLFNPLLSIGDVLNAYAVNLVTLGAEAVLFTLICYVAFMRKDIE
ncbi:MAG: ABC-2 family transporter protein [Methanocella sp. PtaU1.Bin125]|nr:MAG: ABC-2 family transporter protein [Methanocella sp. PtaU1.Bin125]